MLPNSFFEVPIIHFTFYKYYTELAMICNII